MGGGHIGILVAVFLIVGGLVALYRSITAERGSALAQLGFGVTLVNAALVAVLMATDGPTMKEVADTWASSHDPSLYQAASVLEQINIGLFSLWIFIFFGITFILYGLAIALSDVYPKWLDGQPWWVG